MVMPDVRADRVRTFIYTSEKRPRRQSSGASRRRAVPVLQESVGSSNRDNQLLGDLECQESAGLRW